MWVIN